MKIILKIKNGFNLSYHNPKIDDEILLIFVDNNIKIKLPISQLRLNSEDKGFGNNAPLFTDYHRLYRGQHTSTLLINENVTNERRLFLSCDSMMIPIIPILIKYFKSILIIDNRFDEVSHKDIFKNFIATDMVVTLIADNIVIGNRYFNNFN